MKSKIVDPVRTFTQSADTDIPKGLENIPPLKKHRTVKEYAKEFVENMNTEQRKRFKAMIDNGIDAGRSVAELYQIDPQQFVNAVKAII